MHWLAPDSATELSASDKAAGLDVRSVLHNKKRHQRDTPALPRLGSATQIKTIILPFSCINSKLTPQYQLLALTRWLSTNKRPWPKTNVLGAIIMLLRGLFAAISHKITSTLEGIFYRCVQKKGEFHVGAGGDCWLWATLGLWFSSPFFFAVLFLADSSFGIKKLTKSFSGPHMGLR